MGVYEALGVRTVINAAGDLTSLGGTLMLPEVRAAMDEASRAFVNMEELQFQAGRVIAEITGAEAGYVTAGAAAGLALAAAACIARDDLDTMSRLPDTEHLPNEILIQKGHRNPYDRCLRAVGARLVEVGDPERCDAHELEAAVNGRTAAVAWVVSCADRGLPLETVVEVAHRHRIPIIVDAAAALPPPSNLRAFVAAGADLVTFSGGKALRGPQASGILCGRGDLIRSVALQHLDMDVEPRRWRTGSRGEEAEMSGAPRHGIGRSMKVGKEEIAGLVAALQLYLKRDHEAEQRQWESDMQVVARALQTLPGVTARTAFPLPNGRPVPCVLITLAPDVVGMTAREACHQLRQGDPPVFLAEWLLDQQTLGVYPCNLQPGETEILIERLTKLLAPVR